MHFHANYVSTSVFGDGDYYQATFEAEEDTDDTDSPYLLIQRRSVDFTPQKLSIELDRPRDNFVNVTFAMVATEFAEASQVVKIISGEIEPP